MSDDKRGHPDDQAPWRKSLLPIDSTIQDAIQSLNQSAMQIVLVVTADGILHGTITDGDIRRGLLRGLDLTSPIGSVVKQTSLVVPPDMSREVVMSLMRANKFLQVPVVDAERRVVGLHLWDEIIAPTERPNLMVIMAGGRGARLRPYTENCPKPLLPVAGKPMLEHIIERARAEGFQRFLVAIHYLGHMIEDYFHDGSRWNVDIRYIREHAPLGTAGALGLMAETPSAPFLVSNGDVLSHIHYGDLLDFHVRQEATATMAVHLHEWQHPFGVVKTEGVDITSFEEKPMSRSYVNAGVYVLGPEAMTVLQRDEPCDMPTIFMRLKSVGKRTVVYPMHEPWLDVGRPGDYETAQESVR